VEQAKNKSGRISSMYIFNTSQAWALGLGAALAMMTSAAQASSPAEQQAQWNVAARATDAGYAPSAARGKALYERAFNRSAEMPNCVACHTSNPAQQGKHAVTGKAIAPMAPSANAERFADAAKTEKWFKRNCNDVVGRECTAAEKSDFVEFLVKAAK
jgi:mono/diheme cytochrome c family protein